MLCIEVRLEYLLTVGYFLIFQICQISFHLQKSKVLVHCSEDLNEVKDLEPAERKLILDRSGLFENKTGEGINICTSHLDSLSTSKLRKDSKCFGENHLGSPKLRGKFLDNSKVISRPLSLNVHRHTGFILPTGGRICGKCRTQISESVPPLPKKQKIQNSLPNNQTIQKPLPNNQSMQNPLPNNQTIQKSLRNKQLQNLLSSPKSTSSSENQSLAGSDFSFTPFEELQDDRTNAMNMLFKANNMKIKFISRMDRPLHRYSDRQQLKQMEIIHAAFQAILNTVCEYKADQAEVWAKVIETHKMDKKLGYVHHHIRQIIKAYNNCTSDQLRIHVSVTIYEIIHVFTVT